MYFDIGAILASAAILSGALAAPLPVPKGNSYYRRGGGMITIVNKSTGSRDFKVEASMSNPAGTYGATNGRPSTLTVAPGESRDVAVGSPWSGAISDKAGKGARFEFTIGGWNGLSWYNTDFEYGMSDATVKPANGVQRDGSPPPGPARAGEKDYLATARAGWLKLDAGKQQELLATGYVKGQVGGAMDSIYMDHDAPECLVHFLQSVARVRAYVCPGSVAGKEPSEDAKIANMFSWAAKTNHFVITVY